MQIGVIENNNIVFLLATLRTETRAFEMDPRHHLLAPGPQRATAFFGDGRPSPRHGRLDPAKLPFECVPHKKSTPLSGLVQSLGVQFTIPDGFFFIPRNPVGETIFLLQSKKARSETVGLCSPEISGNRWAYRPTKQFVSEGLFL